MADRAGSSRRNRKQAGPPTIPPNVLAFADHLAAAVAASILREIRAGDWPRTTRKLQEERDEAKDDDGK